MNEDNDIKKVSETKKQKLAENSKNSPSIGIYVLAWILLFASTNLMALGVGMFLLEYVEDSRISVSSYMWIGVIANLLFFFSNSYVIYVKMFPKLNIDKVHIWLLTLGTLLALSGTGSTGTEVKGLGLDPIPFIITMLSGWIIFLFFFKKLNKFKDLDE